jgi:hypothetical protein
VSLWFATHSFRKTEKLRSERGAKAQATALIPNKMVERDAGKKRGTPLLESLNIIPINVHLNMEYPLSRESLLESCDCLLLADLPKMVEMSHGWLWRTKVIPNKIFLFC